MKFTDAAEESNEEGMSKSALASIENWSGLKASRPKRKGKYLASSTFNKNIRERRFSSMSSTG